MARGKGSQHAADLWERYIAGPESTADPAGWRTELSRRLIGAAAIARRRAFPA
jgi:hypothetical protein